MTAVLFDLYNTLAYVSATDYFDAKERMADKAGVPAALFHNLWRQYSPRNNRGDIVTVEERVALVLRDLDLVPTKDLVSEIAAIEWELQEGKVVLGASSLSVLKGLKELGIKIGIIS